MGIYLGMFKALLLSIKDNNVMSYIGKDTAAVLSGGISHFHLLPSASRSRPDREYMSYIRT